jgi:hypothetical protein
MLVRRHRVVIVFRARRGELLDARRSRERRRSDERAITVVLFETELKLAVETAVEHDAAARAALAGRAARSGSASAAAISAGIEFCAACSASGTAAATLT